MTPAWTEFTTNDEGPLLAGLPAGSDPPVLLLHGGPGLGFGYLRDLADELAEENDVASYQQRGLEPSAVEAASAPLVQQWDGSPARSWVLRPHIPCASMYCASSHGRAHRQGPRRGLGDTARARDPRRR